MSAHDLQSQGRQAYKRGDFPKALSYFNRALGRQQTVQLYDNRAATHEKLGDFTRALADAKQAIATSNEDPTGYLRAGKVLCKMDKRETALEVYSRALKRVRHVGQGFEQLKKVHDELQHELAPEHSIDPLTVLPRELAITVLEYLNFRQRMAVRRVSKGWASFIRSEPNLWQHLDLGAAKTKVRTSFISTAINTTKGKLTAATLSRLYDFDKVLNALVKHCPLEKLTLAQCGVQSQNLVEALRKAKLKQVRILNGTEVGRTTMREIIATCAPQLEVFTCIPPVVVDLVRDNWTELRLPRLRSLEINIHEFFGTSELSQFLTSCPLLQELRLRSVDFRRGEFLDVTNVLNLRECCPRLRVLELKFGFSDANSLQLPATLEVFSLAHSVIPRVPFWPGTLGNNPARLKDLPDLREVILDSRQTPLQAVLAELFPQHTEPDENGQRQPLSQLRSFRMNRPCLTALDPSDFGVGRCKDLEALALTQCLELDDRILDAIVENLPKLRYLDASGTKVTGAGVKDIVKRGHVRELVLNDCYNLGRDAVDWARAQGVKISARINEGEGGRKVRY